MGIHLSDVAGDHSLCLQLAKSLGHRRLRKANRIGNLLLGHPRIPLQQLEKLIIYLIKHVSTNIL